MIDLLKIPASEAERLAYAEGFTGTAELFGRIDALTAERDKLRDENRHLMDALKVALAEVTRLKNEGQA